MGRMPRPGNYNNYLIDPEGLFVDFETTFSITGAVM